MKFAIMMGTYQRPDGKTPFYLKRALDSIYNQTHQDFKVYLIGDKYEDDKEFRNIASRYPSRKMYSENLPVAVEREKYKDKKILWNVAGLNLALYTIDRILKDGYDYVCHLDHDDYWAPNHLEVINRVIEKTKTVWVCTKSVYIDSVLPDVDTDKEYVEFYPQPCGLIHSSTCINFRDIPLRYRNVYEETGRIGPCDADLWERMTVYFKKNRIKSYFINSLTCFHESEGYVEGKERKQIISKDSLITGVVVSCNTKELIKKAYESVRKFHPRMKIIIVDGSTEGNECHEYVASVGRSDVYAEVFQVGYNIGHGRGMCVGIYYAETPYVLCFDSDTEMIKSPVWGMLSMMEKDTYGVGYVEKTGFDGFEYGAKSEHSKEGWMRYLHPYFQLIQVSVYRKFHPYVHHGAPCFLTILDIHKRGLSDKIIKEFPGLGHTSGEGWTWKGVPREYILHNVAGTRRNRKSKGLHEIEGTWELNNEQV